jgi:hypothetical protein
MREPNVVLSVALSKFGSGISQITTSLQGSCRPFRLSMMLSRWRCSLRCSLVTLRGGCNEKSQSCLVDEVRHLIRPGLNQTTSRPPSHLFSKLNSLDSFQSMQTICIHIQRCYSPSNLVCVHSIMTPYRSMPPLVPSHIYPEENSNFHPPLPYPRMP